MLRKSILSIALISMLLLGADPSTTLAAGRLHLLLGGDTSDPNIGSVIGTNQGVVGSVFRELVPAGSLQVLSPGMLNNNGGKISVQSIQQMINLVRNGGQVGNLTVQRFQPGDSIVFYYMGHGSYNPNQREHYLDYASGAVGRRNLTSLLQSSFPQAQVIALITESCANEKVAAPRSFNQFARENLDDGPNGMAPIIQKLFFQSRGFANINSCQYGQIALTNYYINTGNGKSASIYAPFTQAFTNTLRQSRNNGNMNWNNFHGSVSAQTAQFFRGTYPNGRDVQVLSGDFVKQTSQDPMTLGQLPQLASAQNPQTPPQQTNPRPKPQNNPQTPQQTNPRPQNNSQTSPRPQNNPQSNPQPQGRVYLGVTAEEYNGPGLKVVNVKPDSPATRCVTEQGVSGQIEINDILLKVNGRPVNTTNELVQVLKQSPQQATLEIYDQRTKSVFTVTTNVRN